ncbi:MAG: bifunctional diaminohydroxyphosphoribosylaminopyrimidine deaminase/5-amino-6-(5-phosphoribosylamino)uracil reductase RibD [Ginsengibacter sp.]
MKYKTWKYLNIDEQYMNRCIQLARLAEGNVAPNPMVGAVLVYENKIIGEGFHKKYGEAHAEVNCIDNVAHGDKNLIEKSTLYVSLEPCSHFGKTPPCTDLIIQNNIPRVIIACTDIFKEVAGKGIKKLNDAGIETIVGVLEKECLELNKRFFTFHQKQKPYIILKWAQSANGKIGKKGQRVLISNNYTNRLVHKWRSQEAAILIGTNTAQEDNPSLTTRLWQGKNPVRIIIDKKLRLPSSLLLFDGETPTIIYNLFKDSTGKNLNYVKLGSEKFIDELLQSLFEMNIQSVLVEGGSKTLQSFIDAGLWDEARVITNEELTIENGIAAPEMKNFILEKQEKYLRDTITYYRNSD